MNTLIMLMALLVGQTPPGSPAPAEVLEAVQKSYQGLGDMSVDFSQSYVDLLRGRRPPERGRLWAKADGRVRWSYQEPVRKDFVYDGTKAYFYEPQNSQVTVFEQFEDSQLSVAMRFLWGQGNIKEIFRVGSCDESCKGGEPGDWKVRLTPKQALPTIDRVVLIVDPKTKRPRLSIIFDPLGNHTEYAFSNFVSEPGIDQKKFEFKIPPNVSVLRSSLAAGGGEPPAPKPR